MEHKEAQKMEDKGTQPSAPREETPIPTEVNASLKFLPTLTEEQMVLWEKLFSTLTEKQIQLFNEALGVLPWNQINTNLISTSIITQVSNRLISNNWSFR